MKVIDQERYANEKGLEKTPERYAKMMEFFMTPVDFEFTTFEAKSKNLIVVQDIDFFSHCEHHLAPIIGSVSIGYIPSDKIAGLSKLPRLVEKCSRGVITQEYFTERIKSIMIDKLDPICVIVKSTAYHTCVSARGVQSQNSTTDVWASNATPETTDLFLSLIGRK